MTNGGAMISKQSTTAGVRAVGKISKISKISKNGTHTNAMPSVCRSTFYGFSNYRHTRHTQAGSVRAIACAILSAYVCKCNDTHKPCKYWSVCNNIF